MADAAPPALHCANHPDRETMLRCNRCEKPICYECAILTPVGYRCKECIREQRGVYYNAQPYDLVAGVIVALVMGVVLGIPAYLFLRIFGFFSVIVALLAGPFAGEIVTQAIRRVVHKRRALHMKWAAALAWIAGVLLAGLILTAVTGGAGAWLFVLIFAGLAASTIYARLL